MTDNMILCPVRFAAYATAADACPRVFSLIHKNKHCNLSCFAVKLRIKIANLVPERLIFSILFPIAYVSYRFD